MRRRCKLDLREIRPAVRRLCFRVSKSDSAVLPKQKSRQPSQLNWFLDYCYNHYMFSSWRWVQSVIRRAIAKCAHRSQWARILGTPGGGLFGSTDFSRASSQIYSFTPSFFGRSGDISRRFLFVDGGETSLKFSQPHFFDFSPQRSRHYHLRRIGLSTKSLVVSPIGIPHPHRNMYMLTQSDSACVNQQELWLFDRMGPAVTRCEVIDQNQNTCGLRATFPYKVRTVS